MEKPDRPMTVSHDRYQLARFVTAQDGVFETALAELRSGRKESHWMWFIFPQLRDLGRSSTARFLGISSLEEARAYLAHEVLGPRLLQCTGEVLACGASSFHELFGSPDDLKFRSCMTLFAVASREQDNQFRRALDRWCDGDMDPRTLELLRPPDGGA